MWAQCTTGQPRSKGTGKPANFDEALAQLVAASPYQSMLVKGSTANGSGATPVGGGAPTIGKKYTDCKTPAEKAAWLSDPKNLK